MHRLVAVIALVLGAKVVYAQSPFVRDGSIGEVKKEEAKVDFFETLEVKDWVGQKFIFLPTTPKLRRYGYQLFEPQLPYETWVGKIVTVTDVSDDYLPKVTFRTKDGKVLRSTVYGGTVGGIAPLRDLEYARSKWLGETLWVRGNQLVTWNETTEDFGSVNLERYSPVEVHDIVVGWTEDTPIRLILKAPDGEVGFLDVNVSGTNISKKLREYGHFEDTFLESDPRVTYKWSKEVWNAIEGEKVFIGMTAEQARMSWGRPNEINRVVTERGAEEQWVYRDSYLYISNGIVTAIQN